MPAATQAYRVQDRDLLFTDPSDSYLLRVKDLPDEARPRERLLKFGPGNLSLAELVAILWGVGSRREDVLAMAQRTLKEYGEKTIGHELNPRQLAEIAGIPLGKACQVIASFELGRRFYATSSGRPLQVRNARQAYRYLQDMGGMQKEQLRGLYLNSRYQVIHDEVISIGSLTSNVVHPREVFRPALSRGASAIILAHNHPSGSLEPTMADIEITEQLIEAGEILGIDLLDHIVVTAKSHASIMDFITSASQTAP